MQGQIEKQIQQLIKDGVQLLKCRMKELGIKASKMDDLLSAAIAIFAKHHKLQTQADVLEEEVQTLEEENGRLVDSNIAMGNNVEGCLDNDDYETKFQIVEEICNTLSERRNLQHQLEQLENNDNDTMLIITPNPLKNVRIEPKMSQTPAKASCTMTSFPTTWKPQTTSSEINRKREHDLQQSHNVNQYQPSANKIRKTKDYRSRTQEWPDVPVTDIIEEQNPEILAQKILETGRRIEASKMHTVNKSVYSDGQKPVPTTSKKLISTVKAKQQHSADIQMQEYQRFQQPVSYQQQSLPQAQQQQQQQHDEIQQQEEQHDPEEQQEIENQEPPRANQFEDRLKSIITSVLNEDQRTRMQQASVNQPDNTRAETPKHVKVNEHYQANFESSDALVPSTSCMSDLRYQYEQKAVEQQYQLYIQQEQQRPRQLQRQRQDPVQPQPHKEIRNQQPDYTQVSPAKLALRRHLSQEKLLIQQQKNAQEIQQNPLATRTIGELVSGEIERTLEISNTTKRSYTNHYLVPPSISSIKTTSTVTTAMITTATNCTGYKQAHIQHQSSGENQLEGLATAAAYLSYVKQTDKESPIPSPMTSPNVPQKPSLNDKLFQKPYDDITAASQMHRIQYSPRATAILNNCYSQFQTPYAYLPRADLRPYIYDKPMTPISSLSPINAPYSQYSTNNFANEGLAARVLHNPVKNLIKPPCETITSVSQEKYYKIAQTHYQQQKQREQEQQQLHMQQVYQNYQQTCLQPFKRTDQQAKLVTGNFHNNVHHRQGADFLNYAAYPYQKPSPSQPPSPSLVYSNNFQNNDTPSDLSNKSHSDKGKFSKFR